MITLSLSDLRQSLMASGALVIVENSLIKIINESQTKTFQVSDKSVSYGSYWIDAYNRSIFIEMYSNSGLVASLNIFLGTSFEVLFPNATSNWGSYFFNLHYSSG